MYAIRSYYGDYEKAKASNDEMHSLLPAVGMKYVKALALISIGHYFMTPRDQLAPAGVITSYSLHDTTLYDQDAQENQDMAQPVPAFSFCLVRATQPPELRPTHDADQMDCQEGQYGRFGAGDG